MSIYDAPLKHLEYKPINLHPGLFQELHYMSNGLTFEILNGISRNFQGCCHMTR